MICDPESRQYFKINNNIYLQYAKTKLSPSAKLTNSAVSVF